MAWTKMWRLKPETISGMKMLENQSCTTDRNLKFTLAFVLYGWKFARVSQIAWKTFSFRSEEKSNKTNCINGENSLSQYNPLPNYTHFKLLITLNSSSLRYMQCNWEWSAGLGRNFFTDKFCTHWDCVFVLVFIQPSFFWGRFVQCLVESAHELNRERNGVFKCWINRKFSLVLIFFLLAFCLLVSPSKTTAKLLWLTLLSLSVR